MTKATRVFEIVYVYETKVNTREGIVSVIYAMDAYSEYIFKPASELGSDTSLTLLYQIFNNILESYSIQKHPNPINFITNFSDNTLKLFEKTKAVNHKYSINEIETKRALQPFLDNLKH